MGFWSEYSSSEIDSMHGLEDEPEDSDEDFDSDEGDEDEDEDEDEDYCCGPGCRRCLGTEW